MYTALPTVYLLLCTSVTLKISLADSGFGSSSCFLLLCILLILNKANISPNNNSPTTADNTIVEISSPFDSTYSIIIVYVDRVVVWGRILTGASLNIPGVKLARIWLATNVFPGTNSIIVTPDPLVTLHPT